MSEKDKIIYMKLKYIIAKVHNIKRKTKKWLEKLH